MKLFLKILNFQCTLSEQTKKHKTWPYCLSKSTPELLKYWRPMIHIAQPDSFSTVCASRGRSIDLIKIVSKGFDPNQW